MPDSSADPSAGLPAVAERDFVALLRSELETEGFGRVHEHHARTASTNDRALAWLRERPAPHSGSLVTADAQDAGRGRMGRQWDSQGQDIYASVIVKPGVPQQTIGALGLAVGLGLAEGLEAAVPAVAPRLKWPNDLLVGGRKIAGILCETRWLGSEPEIVVGFGVNVGRTEFAPELNETATSVALELAGDAAPGRARVLAALLLATERRLRAFFAGGFPCISEAYLARCESVGKEVWVPQVQPDGSSRKIMACVEGLDPDGALRVRSAGGGASFRVQSADVWLQPPPSDTQASC